MSTLKLFSPAWPSSEVSASLAEEEIEVWRINWRELSDEAIRCSFNILSEKELAYIEQFEFRDDRVKHAAGRGALRSLIGRYSEVAEESISFDYGSGGKPLLPDEANPDDLRFNIAYAENLILVAITTKGRIGVDIESISAFSGSVGFARDVMIERENERFKSLEGADQKDFFLHLWTCKEAVMKAAGEGLYRSPGEIELHFETGDDRDGGRYTAGVSSGASWELHPFWVTDSALGAVAQEAQYNRDVIFKRYDERLLRELT